MAGRIVIEIERDGEVVPVTAVLHGPVKHEAGVVLHQETSASPRGLGIHLRPLSPGTKEAFKRVQRNHDWLNPPGFKLKISRQSDKLVLAGVDPDSLPPGRYELKLRLGGMKIRPSFPEVDVPRNGDARIRFREKIVRTLALNRPVNQFDQNSQRILTDPRSVLDGLSAANWLTAAKHRDRRQAVLLNVLAKLAAIPVARPAESLSRQVEHVFFAELDRIYCAVSPRFHQIVKAKFRKDAVIDATHKRLLTRLPVANAQDYKLISYRERRRRASLQTVVAVPRPGLPDRTHYVDIDIDGANPGQDLVTFFIHLGEILDPNATDHLRLFKRLDRRQVGDFLYYDVIKV